MQDENIVRDFQVLDGERSVRAIYFVEAGMIRAQIEGRTLIFPVGSDSSEEAVRRLVLGQIHTRRWLERTAERWRRKD